MKILDHPYPKVENRFFEQLHLLNPFDNTIKYSTRRGSTAGTVSNGFPDEPDSCSSKNHILSVLKSVTMSSSDDPHNLQRFVEAQNPVIDQVKQELRSGNKQSHWMWFIFPQVEGLGKSQTSQKYAISSREEAEAYLTHPVLGQRLRECTEITNGVKGRTAAEIFGSPDDLKFRSSMTLFDALADDPTPFRTALKRYYSNKRDETTIQFLLK